jgi:hypothetical protein
MSEDLVLPDQLGQRRQGNAMRTYYFNMKDGVPIRDQAV